MKNLQRYNLGELARTYASDKDNVVCRAYDVDKLEASHAELEAKCAELLEALKALLKFHDDGDYDGPDPAELARAAIAKAERTEESHA